MFITFTDALGRVTIANMISVQGECLTYNDESQYRLIINTFMEMHYAKFPSAENLEAAFLKLRDAIIAKEPYVSLNSLQSN